MSPSNRPRLFPPSLPATSLRSRRRLAATTALTIVALTIVTVAVAGAQAAGTQVATDHAGDAARIHGGPTLPAPRTLEREAIDSRRAWLRERANRLLAAHNEQTRHRLDRRGRAGAAGDAPLATTDASRRDRAAGAGEARSAAIGRDR
jgi:hypothetical protein